MKILKIAVLVIGLVWLALVAAVQVEGQTNGAEAVPAVLWTHPVLSVPDVSGNPTPPSAASAPDAADVKISNDVAQLVYDILAKFNVTGVLSTLGGGGFVLYWLSKFLTNRFPGFGSSPLGQLVTLFIRQEAKLLTPTAGPTVPPRTEELQQEVSGVHTRQTPL